MMRGTPGRDASIGSRRDGTTGRIGPEGGDQVKQIRKSNAHAQRGSKANPVAAMPNTGFA